jgi:hypothetical protein
MAQSRIDKIVDEIEQKGVDVSKVVKRDPKTKKPYSITKSLTFYSKDGNYANRLKEAFRKDAEDAEQESVSNKGNNYRLIFVDGKKRSIYSLNIQERQDKNPCVSLKIVMRDGDVKENDDYDIMNSFFGTGAIELNGIDGLLDGLGNIDMEKFGRDMEKWGEDFGRKMEKYGKKMEKFGKDLEKRDLKGDTVIIRMKKKTA